MVKLIHLFVLSALIVWLAGSGCIGNNASDVKEAGIAPDVAGAEDEVQGDLGAELTSAEVQEIDGDMAELENLLDNASVEEEIVLEEPRE